MGDNTKAFPLADTTLTNQIYELLQQTTNANCVKKGANEVTKALNKGKCEMVVIAGDVVPIEIVLHLPLLCEDKDVPYVFVPSMSGIGRACSVSRAVIAAAILTGTDKQMKTQVDGLKREIEKLFI